LIEIGLKYFVKNKFRESIKSPLSPHGPPGLKDNLGIHLIYELWFWFNMLPSSAKKRRKKKWRAMHSTQAFRLSGTQLQRLD
jgi:hypothetical protein